MAMKALLAAAWRVNQGLPLLIAVLLLLNVIVYLFTHWHVAPWVEDYEGRYVAQQERHRQARQGIAAIATPQSAFRQGREDLATFRAAIPSRAGFPALLGELFTLAEASGLEIERVGYEPKEIEERGLLRYGLNFSVTGTYRQIKLFIYELEQSPRLIIIEDVSLGENAAVDAGATAQVTLRLRLATYFRADAS